MVKLDIMIGLYEENDLLIKDETPISFNITRKLTKEEKKEAWIKMKKELLPIFKQYLKLAQNR